MAQHLEHRLVIIRAQLSELMTGRKIEARRYRPASPGAQTLLILDGLGSGSAFQDIGFSLRKGEILGITGLSDSGRSELALALAGHREITDGKITLEGAEIAITSPADAIAMEIGYIPEDRLAKGLSSKSRSSTTR